MTVFTVYFMIVLCYILGLACSTVISPEAAALQAAQILSLSDHMIWSRLRAKQLNTALGLREADKNIRNDDTDRCN